MSILKQILACAKRKRAAKLIDFFLRLILRYFSFFLVKRRLSENNDVPTTSKGFHSKRRKESGSADKKSVLPGSAEQQQIISPEAKLFKNKSNYFGINNFLVSINFIVLKGKSVVMNCDESPEAKLFKSTRKRSSEESSSSRIKLKPSKSTKNCEFS